MPFPLIERSYYIERPFYSQATKRPNAYDAYLKGRYYGAKFSYEALAYMYTVQSNWPLSPKYAMPRAREVAQKALQTDDTLAGAHTYLATVLLLYDWNRSAAEKELKRALEVNPSHAATHDTYGWFWVSSGRFDEAVSESKRAEELDPLAPETRVMSGSILYYARCYDQATRKLQSNLEIESEELGFSPHFRPRVSTYRAALRSP